MVKLRTPEGNRGTRIDFTKGHRIYIVSRYMGSLEERGARWNGLYEFGGLRQRT
jgi:hypothetical protein